MMSSSQGFDDLTQTFSADRKFFDALMKDPCSESFVEMCIWTNWLQQYLNDIQNSLCDTVPARSDGYRTWVAIMIGGIGHAVGMLTYLSARGVIQEAAASARRALEFLGFVGHLVKDPSKGQFLAPEFEHTPQFKNAFVNGSPSDVAELKQRKTKFRFAALTMGPACTTLWEMFSSNHVHGDSLRPMATGVVFFPTDLSCKLLNRSVEESAKHIFLYKSIAEIVAIELSTLVGKAGVRSARINRAGACVQVWLDKTDPRWARELNSMRKHFHSSL